MGSNGCQFKEKETMASEASEENLDKPTVMMPKSTQLQWTAGPQGTRTYEVEDLEQIRNNLLESQRAKTHQPSLLATTLPYTGQRFLLKPGINTIGRGANNDVVLKDPSVSSMHAKIVYQNGSWRILNLLSTNGTFINGKKQTISPLKPGDKIRLGRIEFLFDCDDTAVSAVKAGKDSRNPSSSGGLFWLAIGGISVAAIMAVLFALIR
jgi:pSer/pThr/pTyr-binding forkhead associated (FHA) protein